MLNRILETDLANLRRRNVELQNDLAAFQKSHEFPSLNAINMPDNYSECRESLISQLEQKTIEASKCLISVGFSLIFQCKIASTGLHV